MPRIGKKKKLQRDLDQIFIFQIFRSTLKIPKPEFVQKATHDYLLTSEIVSQCRYASNRNRVTKSKVWIESILPSLKGSRFRQQLRVNKATFFHLKSILEGNNDN